jgi:hypothetical protein
MYWITKNRFRRARRQKFRWVHFGLFQQYRPTSDRVESVAVEQIRHVRRSAPNLARADGTPSIEERKSSIKSLNGLKFSASNEVSVISSTESNPAANARTAVSLKATDIADSSFIDELERNGFIDRLYAADGK